MEQLKLMSICLLSVASGLAMEEPPQAGPSGEGHRAIVGSYYDFGNPAREDIATAPLSPRSKKQKEQKAYEDAIAGGGLSPYTLAFAKYALGVLYQTLDDGDPRKMLAKKLFAEAICGDHLNKSERVDAYLRLGFFYVGGRYDGGELFDAIRYLEDALRSELLKPDVENRVKLRLDQLEAERLEPRLLEIAIGLDGLDKRLLAYAKYKLGVMHTCAGYETACIDLDAAIESGKLGSEQQDDALCCRRLCSRGRVQQEIKILIAKGQLSAHDLALNKCILAVAYMDDHADYGDKEACRLLGEAIDSKNLTSDELTEAKYHRACLHERNVGDAHAGQQAYDFFEEVCSGALLKQPYLADAQFRLARLLIEGKIESSISRRQNLLNEPGSVRAHELLKAWELLQAVDKSQLPPKQRPKVSMMLGVLDKRAALEKKRADSAALFGERLNAELTRIESTPEVLYRTIITSGVDAKILADAQFELACLICSGELAPRGCPAVKKLLDDAIKSQRLIESRVSLARDMLKEDEQDTWQELEECISTSRRESLGEAVVDVECEKELYARVLEHEEKSYRDTREKLISGPRYQGMELMYKLNEDCHNLRTSVLRCKLMLMSKGWCDPEGMRWVEDNLPLGHPLLGDFKRLRVNCDLEYVRDTKDKSRDSVFQAYYRLIGNKLLTAKQMAQVKYEFGALLCTVDCLSDWQKDLAKRVINEAINSGELQEDQLAKAHKNVAWIGSWRAWLYSWILSATNR